MRRQSMDPQGDNPPRGSDTVIFTDPPVRYRLTERERVKRDLRYWRNSTAPQRCERDACYGSAVVLPISFFSGMVACAVYAAKVAGGSLSVLPAGYTLLVAAAVFLAILTVAVPAPSTALLIDWTS